jgi:hypothetical protein
MFVGMIVATLLLVLAAGAASLGEKTGINFAGWR